MSMKSQNKELGFIGDYIARSMTGFFRLLADSFFVDRYGNRAVVLETIAGVPGMVAGMMVHLQSLRRMDHTRSELIRELLSEAENERMHLMFFIDVAKPTIIERFLIMTAQFIFWHYYLIMYTVSPRVAHRMIGYFEEEAVKSYSRYLEKIQSGEIENIPCPERAIEYYGLDSDAKLSDMIICVRADEQKHHEVNMRLSTER